MLAVLGHLRVRRGGRFNARVASIVRRMVQDGSFQFNLARKIHQAEKDFPELGFSVERCLTQQLPPTVIGTLSDTLLASFTSSIRAPSLGSLSNTLLNSQPDLDTAPPTIPPPVPDSPLAANNTKDDGQPAEAPISSDEATSQLASSLEGGAPGKGGVVVNTGILTGAPPPPPPPIDSTSLPSFGNTSLWQ
jgi:hypothetical protein